MKKLIAIVTSLTMLILVPSLILAQSDKAQGVGLTKKNTVVQDSSETDSEDGEETLSPSELAKQKTASKKLLKVTEVTEDEEVVEEVEELAQEQEQIESESEEVIEVIDQRPAAVKLLIGPDYKNLGQLRSNIVQIRNNIRQLERVQEKAGEDEKAAINEALLELEETASGLQARMYDQMSGFSLFGWLFRWLNGFTPLEENPAPTPDVTITPTATGEADLTPTVTEEEPTATPAEEEEPSPTEEVVPTETESP